LGGGWVVDAGKHATAPLVEYFQLRTRLVKVRLEGEESSLWVNLWIPVGWWCWWLCFGIGKVVIEMDLFFNPRIRIKTAHISKQSEIVTSRNDVAYGCMLFDLFWDRHFGLKLLLQAYLNTCFRLHQLTQIFGFNLHLTFL
jgi:hypothetical protein